MLLSSFGVNAHVLFNNTQIRALPPGVPNTAAYFEVTNDTDTAITFVSGEADFAKRVEIHTHEQSGDMMQMRKLDSITVNAHETLVFQPGGLHVMLLGLTGSVKPGEHRQVTLISATGNRYSFTAVAVKPGETMSMHSHQH
ncbi:copper chaperone PCu(A)C [Pseudobowmanella zhangzhouensis]